MFEKLADLSREIKIPKGIVSMLKSFGLDAKAVEANVMKMGNDAISLLSHCDQRLTSLANQHQSLHEEKQKLVAEVARLHSRFDSLEKLLKERLLIIHGDTNTGSSTDRASAS